ncbi:uncharacterized protein LOC114364113 [Ostrinia furnacalis]|uniref:uncharacterized protein LOC114364113 n=1 Tax=Ostrinia furnacalis TaxID=93504 RepID=UPI0010388051|nr:uncharacterized protein LOC114364113 [Ostrinia furnacalis]
MIAASCSVVLLVLLATCEARLCAKGIYGDNTAAPVHGETRYFAGNSIVYEITQSYPCHHVGTEVVVCVDDSKYPSVHIKDLNIASIVRHGNIWGYAEVKPITYCRKYKGADQAGKALPAPRVTVVKSGN